MKHDTLCIHPFILRCCLGVEERARALRASKRSNYASARLKPRPEGEYERRSNSSGSSLTTERDETERGVIRLCRNYDCADAQQKSGLLRHQTISICNILKNSNLRHFDLALPAVDCDELALLAAGEDADGLCHHDACRDVCGWAEDSCFLD